MLKTAIYRTSLEDHVAIRPITLDDYAAVRYVHAASARRYRHSFHSPEEHGLCIEEIATADYVEALLDQQLYGAFFDRELVGTAGWVTDETMPHHALLTTLHVQPLFAGCSLGRALLRNAERRAVIAGCQSIGVETNRSMVDFFAHMGYRFVAHKDGQLPDGKSVPLIVMERPDLEALTDFGKGLLPPTRAPDIS